MIWKYSAKRIFRMKKSIYISIFLVVGFLFIEGTRNEITAQKMSLTQDPSLNNLVHAVGYKTGKLGELGRVDLAGTGSKDMILIAGFGFGGKVWDGFISSRKEQYSMYSITLPGFDGTPAPPMPTAETSYGEQTWTRAALCGVRRLIVEKKLKKPIIVAHWSIATQIAIALALVYPELVSRVVVVSGIAKNVMADAQFGKTLTVKDRIAYVDKGMAPRWFKTVTRDTWDDNNWYPSDYAVHPVRAMQLWRMAFQPTLPVNVRYLCEIWAQDSTVGLEKLKVPLLIVKPGLGSDYDSIPGQRGGLRFLTQDSWKDVEIKSKLITVKTIENSRAFIMDDQPKRLDEIIEAFLRS